LKKREPELEALVEKLRNKLTDLDLEIQQTDEKQADKKKKAEMKKSEDKRNKLKKMFL